MTRVNCVRIPLAVPHALHVVCYALITQHQSAPCQSTPPLRNPPPSTPCQSNPPFRNPPPPPTGPVPQWTPPQLLTWLSASNAHSTAYSLAQSLLAALGPAATPHAAALAGILGGCLRGSRLLPLFDAASESALYAAVDALLLVGGPGAGMAMAADVIDVLQWRLYGAGVPLPKTTSNTQPTSKKRRRGRGGSGAPSVEASDVSWGLCATAGSSLVAHMSGLQVGLLHLLATLLRTSGQLLPAATRLQLDAIACHFALATESAMLRAQADASGDDAELAHVLAEAGDALLASLQSPCGHRPPLLTPAMSLFRRNAGSRHLPLRRVCGGALVALEALTHPRGVPTPVPLAPGAMAPARVLGTIDVLTADAVVLDYTASQGPDEEVADTVGRHAQHDEERIELDNAAGPPEKKRAAAGTMAPVAPVGPVGPVGHVVPGAPVVSGEQPPVNGMAPRDAGPAVLQRLPEAGVVFGAAPSAPAPVAADGVDPVAMDDSDGPLPEIDSGSSSSEDEDM